LSSNLLKGVYTHLQQEDTRVIDTNELVIKRIEELSVKMKRGGQGGFSAGLNAPEIEFESLQNGEVTDEASQGNVIKANEDAKAVLERAKLEAEELLENAQKDARAMQEEAKAAIEKERENAVAVGKQQGYEEGTKQAQAEVEGIKRQLAEKEKELDATYQKKIDELEPQFIDTLTGIYEHIFHVELQSYREVLVHLISSAMRKIEGNRNFIIHVSKDDYPYVSMQKKQIAAGTATSNGSMEVIEDMTLSKNECLIETESGIFDCGLGTQLSELSQKLRLLSYEKEPK